MSYFYVSGDVTNPDKFSVWKTAYNGRIEYEEVILRIRKGQPTHMTVTREGRSHTIVFDYRGDGTEIPGNVVVETSVCDECGGMGEIQLLTNIVSCSKGCRKP